MFVNISMKMFSCGQSLDLECRHASSVSHLGGLRDLSQEAARVMHKSTAHDHSVCAVVVGLGELTGLGIGGTSNHEDDEVLRLLTEVKWLQGREALGSQFALHHVGD